jgi:aminopeptidase N
VTGEKPIIDEGLDDLGRVLNSNVYQKAGFTLHMLRREIGDSAFFRGIRSYYMKHRHGNALTEDFQREVEASSGRKLGWFFDQWMRRPGVANLTVAWRWDARASSLVLTASQDAANAPYQLGLSMDVTDARGKVHRVRTTVPAARVGTLQVRLRIDGAPSAVVFDPDVSILGTVTAK